MRLVVTLLDCIRSTEVNDMFSNTTNAKKKQMEKISICGTDFLTNTQTDVQISTPSGLCLDGLNCGIPTRTTPTLTPTTLRNIEQTFIELQGQTESHHNQAGFMPPVIHPQTQTQLNTQGSSVFMNVVDTKSWQGGTTVVSDAPNPEMLRNITSSSVNTPPSQHTPSASSRKNVGGRRPNRDSSISAEEEEKRKLRRERNKLAAARCRKRRLDHTNELLEETEGLESKKMSLQNEIQQLQQEKDELEFLLESHKAVCHRLNNAAGPPSPVDVKPAISELKAPQFVDIKMSATSAMIPASSAMTSAMPAPQLPGRPRPRPTSLNVVSRHKEPVPISTPTSGVHFNFDSLMEGGTGLTPVSGPLAPSCSSQQRSQAPDLSSPDSVNTKLVSL